MHSILMVIAGVALTLLALRLSALVWSFAAQSPSDYAAEGPPLDIREALDGRVQVHGVLHDFTGRARARFVGEMAGAFDGETGVIDETFRYDDGSTAVRQWRISFAGPGRFTATADDIVGIARGEQAGDAVRLRYRLRLPESAGGHVLDVVDWLYLLEDGTIINRSEMRKLGLKVAELTAAMTPPARPAAR